MLARACYYKHVSLGPQDLYRSLGRHVRPYTETRQRIRPQDPAVPRGGKCYKAHPGLGNRSIFHPGSSVCSTITYARRRAERTSLGPGLEHPSLRSDSNLAARRRAEAHHVVFFSTKHPSPARELQLLCVYSRMIRSRERRALGALLSLFSRSEPTSANS